MDIATTAIDQLAPYLAESSVAFAKVVGEEAARKVGEIYNEIKIKFKGDRGAEQILDLTEKNPNSERRQIALKEVLAKKMAEDPNFAENMGQLVKEAAKALDKRNVIASGKGSIAIGNDTKNSTLITGDGNVISGRGGTERN